MPCADKTIIRVKDKAIITYDLSFIVTNPLLVLRHHLAAFASARAARLGTDAAVLHALVLIALGGASVAHVGADTAHALCVLAVPGHVPAGYRADVGAIPVQLNAPRQHFHIVLSKARSCASFARFRTIETRLDTTLILILF
jgi:hypothetical protein